MAGYRGRSLPRSGGARAAHRWYPGSAQGCPIRLGESRCHDRDAPRVPRRRADRQFFLAAGRAASVRRVGVAASGRSEHSAAGRRGARDGLGTLLRPSSARPTTVRPRAPGAAPERTRMASVRPANGGPRTVRPANGAPGRTVRPRTVRPRTVRPTNGAPATVRRTTARRGRSTARAGRAVRRHAGRAADRASAVRRHGRTRATRYGMPPAGGTTPPTNGGTWPYAAPEPKKPRRGGRLVAVGALTAVLGGLAGGGLVAALDRNDPTAAGAITMQGSSAPAAANQSGTAEAAAATAMKSVVTLSVRGQQEAGTGSGVVDPFRRLHPHQRARRRGRPTAAVDHRRVRRRPDRPGQARRRGQGDRPRRGQGEPHRAHRRHLRRLRRASRSARPSSRSARRSASTARSPRASSARCTVRPAVRRTTAR